MRSSDNAQNLPPVPSKRVSRLRVIGVVLLLPVILYATLVCITGVTQYLSCVFSERVYEADAQYVDPALEGKLVSLYVDKIEAPRGQGAADTDFGVQDAGIAVFRYFVPAKVHGRIKVNYNNVHGVSDQVSIAPCVRAGEYELLAAPSFWQYESAFELAKKHITPLSVPDALAPFVVEMRGSSVLLKTADTGPAASQFASLVFVGLPHEIKGEFVLIGRQRGNQLDMREPDCGLYHESSLQWHTHRYAVPSVLLPWYIEIPLFILACALVLFFSWRFVLNSFKWGKRAGVRLPISCTFVPVLCGSSAILVLYKSAQLYGSERFENVPTQVLTLMAAFMVFFFIMGMLSLVKKSPDAHHLASGE